MVEKLILEIEERINALQAHGVLATLIATTQCGTCITVGASHSLLEDSAVFEAADLAAENQ